MTGNESKQRMSQEITKYLTCYFLYPPPILANNIAIVTLII